jgi:hypothetical protein
MAEVPVQDPAMSVLVDLRPANASFGPLRGYICIMTAVHF